MNLYFDTSALVKYYHKEQGSEIVTNLIQSPDNLILISEIAIIEFISSLHKKHRMNELSESNLMIAVSAFKSSLSGFIIEPFTGSVRIEAEKIIEKYGKSYSIRTLDSLQIATFLLIAEKNTKFVCADTNLNKVVIKLHREIINPGM